MVAIRETESERDNILQITRYPCFDFAEGRESATQPGTPLRAGLSVF